jgi:hypothetical protein
MELKVAIAEEPERETLCQVLKHPLRVRILDVLNERDLSPIQFLRERLMPGYGIDEDGSKISTVAYHFRQLEKAGCIEVVNEIQKRGSVEHIYRGKARVYFTDAEFAKLTQDERRALSGISFQGIIARVESALSAGTMDARNDRHLSWRAMEVDERGWAEVMTALADCFGNLEQIRHDSEDRLAETGDRPVPMTYSLLGFESPPAPTTGLNP